jgi:hypothetical protein
LREAENCSSTNDHFENLFCKGYQRSNNNWSLSDFKKKKIGMWLKVQSSSATTRIEGKNFLSISGLKLMMLIVLFLKFLNLFGQYHSLLILKVFSMKFVDVIKHIYASFLLIKSALL